MTIKNKGVKKDKQEPSNASFDEITKEGPGHIPETENDCLGTSKVNKTNPKMPYSFLVHHINDNDNDNDEMTMEGPELLAATEPNFHTNPKNNVSNGDRKGQKQDGPSFLFSTQDDKGCPSSMPSQLDCVSADSPVQICNTECENRNAIAASNRRSRERRKRRRQNEQDLYHTDDDEREQPGAFAVAGIGAGNPSNVWESTGTHDMFHNIEASNIPANNQHNTNEPENLINAIVVDDGAIQEAEAVSEEMLKRNKRRRAFCSFVALTLIIVTIVLAIVLTKDKQFDPSQSPSQSQVPSTSPSLLPSSSPTTSFRLPIRSLLEGVSPQLNETFDDDTSPQFKALRWLESNHTDLFNTYTEDRIIQRFVLATLYYSTQGEQWIQSNDWLDSTQHECDWFSSHPNNRDYERCSDNITYDELKLTSNQLKGTLPREMHLLSNLLLLDLSDNELRGSLPSELGLLKNIKTIKLNGNSLDGSLPTELSDLNKNLMELDLSSNAFVGKIPSVLGLLIGLESLEINENVLSGAIFSEIGILSNLKLLSLMGNNLDGTIPSQVASMQRLEILDLNDNLFSGAIPLTTNQTSTQPFLPILPKLKELCVRSNFITGALPSQIGLMSDLKVLDMRSNRLQSIIPSEIGQLMRLGALDLSENNNVHGTLPTELGLVIQLESLDLSCNDLSGTIPETIWTLVKLKLLDLGTNRVSGTIPDTIVSLVNLESLHLGNNSLSSTIPEIIGSLVNLESLYLGGNRLSSTIPETIRSLDNLESLGLSENSFTGPLPSELGELDNLDVLRTIGNDFTGEVPNEICELRRTNNIREFDLDCENITCDCCFDHCPNRPRIPNSASTPTCTDGMTLLQVAIGTDRNPEGVEWDVVDESVNEILLQGGSLTHDDRWDTILEETCVSNNACLVFTVRGSNGHGYTSWIPGVGDRFMVHLNGSELSNGRFQEAGGRFYFGGNSFCVVPDRLQACSVTHPSCDIFGLECSLDNDGGFSGFCNPGPSLPPIGSPAPLLSIFTLPFMIHTVIGFYMVVVDM